MMSWFFRVASSERSSELGSQNSEIYENSNKQKNGEILRSHTSLSAFKNTQRNVVLYNNEISDGERRVR